MTDKPKKTLADQLREKRAAQKSTTESAQSLADRMREQVEDEAPQALADRLDPQKDAESHSLADQLRDHAEEAVKPGTQSLADQLHDHAEEAVKPGAQSLADQLSESASAGESEVVHPAGMTEFLQNVAEQAMEHTQADQAKKSLAEQMHEQQKRVDETQPESLAEQIRRREEQDNE